MARKLGPDWRTLTTFTVPETVVIPATGELWKTGREFDVEIYAHGLKLRALALRASKAKSGRSTAGPLLARIVSERGTTRTEPAS